MEFLKRKHFGVFQTQVIYLYCVVNGVTCEFHYSPLVRVLKISYYWLFSAEDKMELQNNQVLPMKRVLDFIVFRMLRRGDNLPNTHPFHTDWYPDLMLCFKFVIFPAQSTTSHIISSCQHSKGSGIQNTLYT